MAARRSNRAARARHCRPICGATPTRWPTAPRRPCTSLATSRTASSFASPSCRGRCRWRRGVRGRGCPTRWSAGSTCARTGRRWARYAPAAWCAATSRSPHRGAPCARACTSRPATVRIARRDEIAAHPPGDLLQAGPVARGVGRRRRRRRRGLLRRRRTVRLRHHRRAAIPRAALGVAADGTLIAVACDGRSDQDCGLTITELSTLLVALGAESAINLDGGGSTTLVCDGVLRNVPARDARRRDRAVGARCRRRWFSRRAPSAAGSSSAAPWPRGPSPGAWP